jgi:hypothetical protein
MRRQLQKFLPIVLIALAVQILAPIAVSWAAVANASDPLQAAEICHSLPSEGSSQTNPGADPHAHDGACLVCCAVQAAASIDTPHQIAFLVPVYHATPVVWSVFAADVLRSAAGSSARARAPPLPS